MGVGIKSRADDPNLGKGEFGLCPKRSTKNMERMEGIFLESMSFMNRKSTKNSNSSSFYSYSQLKLMRGHFRWMTMREEQLCGLWRWYKRRGLFDGEEWRMEGCFLRKMMFVALKYL
jgi:hypothetical protein